MAQFRPTGSAGCADLTRRQLLRRALALGALASAGGLLPACGASGSAAAPPPAPAQPPSSPSPAAASPPAATGPAAAPSPAAASSPASASPAAAAPASGPWSAAPSAPKPDRLVGVHWQYGNIYDTIYPKFERDWGVKAEAVLAENVEPQVAKLAQMFAANDQIDVSMCKYQFLASYIQQGLVQPIDDLPGAPEYIRDFTPFARTTLQAQGKTWGLPYFATVWLNWYYEDKLQKAGIQKPFTTWEEMVEQAQKAKRDGVAQFPILWVGGVGTEQLPGTWFTLVWNRGGTVFDKDLAPQFGPGSIARETLKWWRQTFVDWQISDPKSLDVRFIPAAQAFNSGDYLYLPVMQHYYMTFTNDPAKSPIAGKVKFFLMPGPGYRSLGFCDLYFLSATTKNRDWAWLLLQLLGGKDKSGDYFTAKELARSSMLGSGYTSLMSSPFIADAWKQWGNVDVVLQQWEKSASMVECAPASSEPWFTKWLDQVNVHVQDCLRGKIDADRACDNITKAVDDARGSA